MKKVFYLVGILLIIAIISLTASLLLINNDMNEFVIPKGTKFIAHRGLSSQYYENTEQAFIGAGQSDFFFAIETDIWLTADGVWVCAHDIDPFKDVTKKINEITFEEALTLPLDTSNFEFGILEEEIYITTFERYLDICIEYAKMPVIELKYVPQINDLEELVSYISSKIDLNRVMFISFQLDNITNLYNINADLRLMQLTNKSYMASILTNSGKHAGLNGNLVTKEMVAKIQEGGAYINVWTINDIEQVKKFIDWGVDFITTDYIFAL